MAKDTGSLFWEDAPKGPRVSKRIAPEKTWERDGGIARFSKALAFTPNLYSDFELLNAQVSKEALVYDVEVYANYFCVSFLGVNSSKVISVELYGEASSLSQSDAKKLKWILDSFCIIGFNSIDYDIVILALAVTGRPVSSLQHATEMLIAQGMRPKDVLSSFKCQKLKDVDHIDLIEVAPLDASLKIYGGRLHTAQMQDLPFPPGSVLSREQAQVVRWYNINDLNQTLDLLNGLQTEIQLRIELSKEYSTDLRSKSDAQIAEAIIGNGIKGITGRYPQRVTVEPGRMYRYSAPSFIKFKTNLLQRTLERFTSCDLVVGEDGKIILPDGFDNFTIEIAGKLYKLGIGGLHSQEEGISCFSTPNKTLLEVDVASFYPFIIILLRISPAHLGEAFLEIFTKIVYRRLDAKHKKIKKVADSLKIVINGTFGKLGSEYSIFYEPDLLIRVTFTGQLALLMLVEDFELHGIPVVSANTDGILTDCPNDKIELMRHLVKDWERTTGFMMEESPYWSTHKRDVNNYVSVKPGGNDVTTKGIFKEPGLQKNPTNQICFIAVREFVANQTPVEVTIRNCKEITKFVTVRTVKGGAVKIWGFGAPPAHANKEELVRMAGYSQIGADDWSHRDSGELATMPLDFAYRYALKRLSPVTEQEYLGKAVRWYYAKGIDGEIVYASSGNKVPRSDGAKPLMELPSEFPCDVDHSWYIQEANDLLKQIGYPGY